MLKINKKLLTLSMVVWFFIFISPAIAASGICFNPQIDIPGMEKAFTEKCGDNGFIINSQSIANYILVIFEYFLGALGILAAIMMMIGGMIWLTAGGSSQKVSEGQSYITSSIAGLLLTIFSITILATINPDLTVFKPTIIQTIKEAETTDSMKSSMLSASKSGSGTSDSMDDIKSGNIKDVAQQMIGKFTYTIDPNKRLKIIDGTRYIDCSTFACSLLKKSGYTVPNPASCNTENIFTGVSPSTPNLDTLEAGTIVGWPKTATNGGHVWVSIGNGQYAEAHGGTGRNPGNAVQIKDAAYVKSVIKKFSGIDKPYIKRYPK